MADLQERIDELLDEHDALLAERNALLEAAMLALLALEDVAEWTSREALERWTIAHRAIFDTITQVGRAD